MKMWKQIKKGILFSLIIVFCLGLLSDGCEKFGKNVTCSGGCNDMSWGISGESGEGGIEVSMTCTRDYVGSKYVETCTGTRTYTESGNTYEFTAIFDWPNCTINVEVEGVGKCNDKGN